MAWNQPATKITAQLITVGIYNDELDGNIVHLHTGLHIMIEDLAFVSGDIWAFSANFLTGKIFVIAWKNTLIKRGGWTEGAAPSAQITFTAATKDELNGGASIGSGEQIWGLALKNE